MAGNQLKLSLHTKDSFRILIVADVQDWKVLNADKQLHIEKLIHQSNPDLIVLLGDMLWGPAVWTKKHAEKVISSIIAPIEKFKIPFAFVTGNHDMDSPVSVDSQMKIYLKSPYCLTPGNTERDCPEAYSIDVLDTGDHPIARLLFLDSGATRISLSEGVQYLPPTQEQLAFSQALFDDPSCPPVFVFQHIPVPEIYQLTETVAPETPESVRGHGPNRGKHLVLKDPKAGILGEAPCPSWENTEQFDAWTKSGVVRAAVFGHDHKNSFEAVLNGVNLIQTSCAGLSCYGDKETRGGRLLTLMDDGQYMTSPIYYKDLV